MCGIVGYTGFREAEPILLEGLRRLEYRGYDSAGVATLAGPRLSIRKKAGRIAQLAAHLGRHPAPGTLVGARLGSPLVLGINEGESFLASDPAALAGHAAKVVYLDDHQVCVLKGEDWRILNRERGRVAAAVHDLDVQASDLDPGEY